MNISFLQLPSHINIVNKSLSTKLRINYFQSVMRDIHAAVMKSDFALN